MNKIIGLDIIIICAYIGLVHIIKLYIMTIIAQLHIPVIVKIQCM